MSLTESVRAIDPDDALRSLHALGEVLRNMRKQCGLTQEALASLAGFARTTVHNVEKTGQDMGYLNMRDWLAASGSDWRALGEALQQRDPLSSLALVDSGDVMLAALTFEPLEALGVTVRTYRGMTGLNQEAFGHRCRLERSHFRTIERGGRSPRFTTLRRIVDQLPVDWRGFFHFVHRLDPIVRRPLRGNGTPLDRAATPATNRVRLTTQ